MRRVAAVVAIFALSQTAIAQTPECKSISEAGARLACYDRAAPPAASAKPVAGAKVPVSKGDSAKYVDSISAEDAAMSAKMKNICRGC
jgi:hypothetical protein